MKSLYPVRGIITVLNAPFDESDRVDVPALKRHAEYAMRAGVSGFLVPALASEVDSLTARERLEMVSAALEVANGTLPVFAGTYGADLRQQKQQLKSYLELGCREVLFQIPFESEAQFKDRFYRLAELQPEVIMLQDWDRTGYGLPDSVILDLFEQVEAFRCLKIETVPASTKYTRLLNLTGGFLHVSGGWAVTQMIEGLRRGVHAFMPTAMHYIYTQIFRDYDAGMTDSARQLYEAVLPAVSFSNQHLDLSIQFFKRLLWRQGIYGSYRVRSASMSFDDVHEEIANELIDRVLDLEASIQSRRTTTLGKCDVKGACQASRPDL